VGRRERSKVVETTGFSRILSHSRDLALAVLCDTTRLDEALKKVDAKEGVSGGRGFPRREPALLLPKAEQNIEYFFSLLSSI
jgi:hypothetical protein